MVVCFRCSAETKLQLDGLLQSGGYKDYGEVMTTAIATLSTLECETVREGTVFYPEGPASYGSTAQSAADFKWEGD